MADPRILTLDDVFPVDPHGLYQESPSGLYVPTRPRRRRPLRVADLFCGAGGFSLGVQQAGLNVVAAVEWDPWASQTYLGNLGSAFGCAIGYVDDADRARHQKILRKLKESSSSGWIGRHNHRRDGSGCRALIMGDASKITGEMIRDALAAIGESGEIDVVIGGPPCQGMSSMGKQKPDDPRNNLVLEFVRLADELGAEVFMMENGLEEDEDQLDLFSEPP
jgi:DNA (cytosine-5)-methyltransferase 1